MREMNVVASAEAVIREGRKEKEGSGGNESERRETPPLCASLLADAQSIIGTVSIFAGR